MTLKHLNKIRGTKRYHGNRKTLENLKHMNTQEVQGWVNQLNLESKNIFVVPLPLLGIHIYLIKLLLWRDVSRPY